MLEYIVYQIGNKLTMGHVREIYKPKYHQGKSHCEICIEDLDGNYLESYRLHEFDSVYYLGFSLDEAVNTVECIAKMQMKGLRELIGICDIAIQNKTVDVDTDNPEERHYATTFQTNKKPK